MSETTTYPHADLISENNINVADLNEKTQKLITKFAAETDEDKKEALDASIYEYVEDYLEAKADAAKKAGVKAKIAERKTKKLDVSTAGTATGKDGKTKDEKNASTTGAKETTRSPLATIFGR